MRILRTIKFVKDLRVMLEGILVSGSSIVWALLILLSMQYMLAIVIMNIVKLNLENDAGVMEDPATVNREFFLDADNCYTTIFDIIWMLFLGITGGADWYDYIQPLADSWGLGWQWVFRIIFLIYISLVQLCVLNILTGVFVENANKITGQDETTMLSAEMEERTRFNDMIAKIFEEVCEDDSIDFEQFEEIVGEESIQKQFRSLGIELDLDNARNIFDMISGGGEDARITCEQFQSGIYRMHGPAKNIDMAQLIVIAQKTALLLDRIQKWLPTIGGWPKRSTGEKKVSRRSETPLEKEEVENIIRQRMSVLEGKVENIRKSRRSQHMGATTSGGGTSNFRRSMIALGAMGQGIQGGAGRVSRVVEKRQS
jgi:hypothetical protein